MSENAAEDKCATYEREHPFEHMKAHDWEEAYRP